MESEKELYEPIREFLHSKFKETFGNCHLEITANGCFSETIKMFVRHDIIFTFLKRRVSPDLAGFTFTTAHDSSGELLPLTFMDYARLYGASVRDFITVEIKLRSITLQDIYQAKLYGDLFSAKYALLISPQPISEEIKRLDRELSILGRFMSGFTVYILQWQIDKKEIVGWEPKSPFVK